MEISNEIKHKLEEVVEIWANDHLDGRPAILAPGVYFSLENKLREQTEKIYKAFPLPSLESGLTPRAADAGCDVCRDGVPGWDEEWLFCPYCGSTLRR